MKVRVLGCSGAIAKDCRTTSFLIDERVLIDAGTGVGDLSLDEMRAVDDVFLTHSHLDHIAALPMMLDAVASRRAEPLRLHALPDTIAALQQHIFNDVIWPDFSRIPSQTRPFVRYQPLQMGQCLQVAGVDIEVLPARHTVPLRPACRPLLRLPRGPAPQRQARGPPTPRRPRPRSRPHPPSLHKPLTQGTCPRRNRRLCKPACS